MQEEDAELDSDRCNLYGVRAGRPTGANRGSTAGDGRGKAGGRNLHPVRYLCVVSTDGDDSATGGQPRGTEGNGDG